MIINVTREPPDATQRRCYDCAHLKAAVSWWCTNDEAVKYRGTAIPGVRDCHFWAPAKYKPKRSNRPNIFTRLWRAFIG